MRHASGLVAEVAGNRDFSSSELHPSMKSVSERVVKETIKDLCEKLFISSDYKMRAIRCELGRIRLLLLITSGGRRDVRVSLRRKCLCKLRRLFLWPEEWHQRQHDLR